MGWVELQIGSVEIFSFHWVGTGWVDCAERTIFFMRIKSTRGDSCAPRFQLACLFCVVVHVRFDYLVVLIVRPVQLIVRKKTR